MKDDKVKKMTDTAKILSTLTYAITELKQHFSTQEVEALKKAQQIVLNNYESV